MKSLQRYKYNYAIFNLKEKKFSFRISIIYSKNAILYI